jgi:histidine triad (HIT) family protein
MVHCLFCDISAKKIPSKIEFENDSVIAFHDINPQAPTHLLVVPKKHISQLSDIHVSDVKYLSESMLVVQKLASERHLDEGYRVVLNNGAKAGQTVFHIHFHLLGGRLMTWPPG